MRKENECCPLFHPEKWDNKTHNWDNKRFLKSSIPTLFHIPFPPMIGNRVTKMMKESEEAHKLAEDPEDTLLLFTDPSPFQSEMYLSVTGDVPHSDNTLLSGTFLSRVFEGKYNATPKFMKQMDSELSNQDKNAKNYYVHYAYCPKCAKEAGHNYVVLFAEMEG